MAGTEQPGWRPDPQQPGMLRWWNGLGWSDARKAVGGGAVRPAVVRLPDGAVAPVTAPVPPTAARQAAPGRSSPTANPFAIPAMLLGLLGVPFGLLVLVPLLGLLLALAGLVRSRRLAAAGSVRTGLVRSVIGLVFSVLALLLWVPVIVEALQQVAST